MGPRLVGRGKCQEAGDRTNEKGFNGAASCGTRKVGIQSLDGYEPIRLQWGRVLWDAESTYTSEDYSPDLKLQWGRVLWDAESSPKPRK